MFPLAASEPSSDEVDGHPICPTHSDLEGQPTGVLRTGSLGITHGAESPFRQFASLSAMADLCDEAVGRWATWGGGVFRGEGL